MPREGGASGTPLHLGFPRRLWNTGSPGPHIEPGDDEE
jgi:hypothetical protein